MLIILVSGILFLNFEPTQGLTRSNILSYFILVTFKGFMEQNPFMKKKILFQFCYTLADRITFKMSDGNSKEELDKLHEAFAIFDKNGD